MVPQRADRSAHLVVDAVHPLEPVAEDSEPLSGQGQRLGVAVQAHDHQVRMSRQQCLGVATQPEGRVHRHRRGSAQRRSEQLEAAFEQDRHMTGIRTH